MVKRIEDENKVNGWQALDGSGNDYASMAGMSDIDRAALRAAQSSWARADTQEGRDAAHRQAEAIRAKYGYSGGVDGSQYLPYGGTKGSGFSYGAAPSYVSRYQEQIDGLARSILGRPAFSYDYKTDPNYQQYEEAYTRNGQRAMQDVLGQAAARTGGLASSYADTAAQQTYDGYMAALADKVPELRQLAYSMYQDEGNNMRNNLAMLQGLEDSDYGQYMDRLGQFNTDRSFNYGVYSDDWSRGYQEKDDAYQRALDKAQTLGAAGDFSAYQGLGYTDAEIQQLERAYQREQAAANAGRYGSSSGGGNDDDAPLGNDLFAEAMAWASKNGGDAEDYVKAYYKQFGYESQSEALAMLNMYRTMNPETVNVPGYGEITYEKAEELVQQGVLAVTGLDANGVPTFTVSGAEGQGGRRRPSRTQNMVAR